MEYQEDVEYMVSDSVFTKVCTLALEQLHICEGKKGCQAVRHDDGTIAAHIHILGTYDENLPVLAMTVQHHVSEAIRQIIDPKGIQVDVTIDDIIVP